MMNFRSKVKRGLLAIFAFALMMSATVKAQAIEINPNDLILVLYGNNTEYYQLIGQTPGVINTGGTFNISGSGVSTAGPATTTQWALVSFNTTTGDFSGDPTNVNLTFRGASTPSTIPADAVFGNLANWAFNVTAASTNPTSGTFSRADSSSFFNQVDGGNGDGRLGGALPAGTSATGLYGQTLTILAGDFNTGHITNTGATASLSLINPSNLSAGALLSLTAPAVAPVPLPPSVVLFLSGLLGMVGVARRRLIGA